METSYLRKGPETHNGYTKMMTMITIDLRAWKQFADWHAKFNLFMVCIYN